VFSEIIGVFWKIIGVFNLSADYGRVMFVR
jgi:hypothetical protein